MTHEKLYRFCTSDASPRAEDWRAPCDPRVWYVLAFDGQELLGLFLVIEAAEAWDIHVCLLPHAWGARALAASRAIGPWMFEATPCQRLTCAIRADNALARQLARRAGFTETGRLPASWEKNGRKYDQICMELRRPALAPKLKD